MRGVILTARRGDGLKPIPWIEIDSPHYWRACTHIAPVLDDAVPCAGAGVRRAADHV
jgi:hypothetical protein